jgi:membrane protein YdbS with pleckstrin-like domain
MEQIGKGKTLWGYFFIFQIALIVLKVVGIFTVPWGIVLIPLWIMLAFTLTIIIVIVVVAAIKISKDL